jgi:glycosyltransferase involved in cell wall biosynthesis
VFVALYLPVNIGLGGALAQGLKQCKHKFVARMDSDDISRFDRFEKQIAYFETQPSLSVCGSNIAEFVSTHQELSGERIVPEKITQIKNFAKYRNPINHPTVMFKRSDISNVGGYLPMPCFEDYYLWIRCIMEDLEIYNIQQNLVFMRGGQPQLERRSGFSYVKHEWSFLAALLKLRFLNIPSFFFIFVLRSFARIAPAFVLRSIYKQLRS